MSREAFIEYHLEREATVGASLCLHPSPPTGGGGHSAWRVLNVLRIYRCKCQLIFFKFEGEQCYEVFLKLAKGH